MQSEEYTSASTGTDFFFQDWCLSCVLTWETRGKGHHWRAATSGENIIFIMMILKESHLNGINIDIIHILVLKYTVLKEWGSELVNKILFVKYWYLFVFCLTYIYIGNVCVGVCDMFVAFIEKEINIEERQFQRLKKIPLFR